MVYQCLLERDEKTIWRIYSLGRREEVVSYEKLQSEFHFTAKKIQRLCEWWSEIERKKKIGIDFIPIKRGVQLQVTPQFCERAFWYQLLSESLTFQLLWQKLTDPLATITQLSQQHYVARKTIWRRLEGLKPLWQNFNLRLDDNFQNCIMGLESQKRYLILQLKKMQMVAMHNGTDELLAFMGAISQRRADFGFKISIMETKILHSRAPQIPYHLDERGWQFLIQQLFGMEIWLPKNYEKLVMEIENELSAVSLITIQDIYRYHLCLQLFCGDSLEEFFLPQMPLPEAIVLEKLSQEYVDKYARFSRKHIHIVNGYDYLLRKKNSSLQIV